MAASSLVLLLRVGLSMGAAAALAAVSVADTRSALLREGRDVWLPLGSLQRAGDEVARNERRFAEPAFVIGNKVAIQRAAADALAHDPLDVTALRQFGISAALLQPGREQVPLRLAEHISRRDLLTQLALVEADVASGDVQGILHHYDRAMTVHPEVTPLLTQVLAPAINEADVRAALTVFARRPWFPGLFESALGQGAEAAALGTLLREARPALGGVVADRLRAILVGQLVTRGDYANARELIIGDRTMRALVGDLGFSSITTDPRFAPLSWRFSNDAAVQAQFDGSRAAQVEVAAERSGALAERMTLLQPGTYRLAVQLDPPSGGPAAQVTWQVNCLDGAGGKAVMAWSPAARTGRTLQEFAFVVPVECPAQQWRILAAAAASQVPSRISLTQNVVN